MSGTPHPCLSSHSKVCSMASATVDDGCKISRTDVITLAIEVPPKIPERRLSSLPKRLSDDPPPHLTCRFPYQPFVDSRLAWGMIWRPIFDFRVSISVGIRV